MALSDVTVKVNLVTSAGVEPVWYPLLLAEKDSAVPVISYAECSSLEQLAVLIADYKKSDDNAARKKKLADAKKTKLYLSAYHMFLQENHPNRFAVCIIPENATIEDAKTALEPYLDKGWRQLVPVYCHNVLFCLQLAEYIENLEQRKMLFFEVSSPDSYSVTDTGSSKKYTLSDYARTVAVYHPSCETFETSQYPVCTVIGAVAGKAPGSINYRNMIVKGIAPVALTEEELETLHANGFMTLVERAGDVVTSQGKSASGERYIDTIDIEDYVVQQLIYVSQKALNVNDIVPYNNDGISILENAAISVMLDCCDKGMIAKTDTNTYAYEVNYPAIGLVPEEDIAARVYKLGTVSFTVQGAIDKEEITVDMTL